jgi:DNA mismatch endonuclease (patch repair protein)
MDTVTPNKRSQIMARVKSRDTKPEMEVRRLVYGMGYRYRLYGANLPGKPDIVFRRMAKVIFVHGCFWHRHPKLNCTLSRLPKSRLDFWLPKLDANRLRDTRNVRRLREIGWRVLTIWECELKRRDVLERKIRRFLDA